MQSLDAFRAVAKRKKEKAVCMQKVAYKKSHLRLGNMATTEITIPFSSHFNPNDLSNALSGTPYASDTTFQLFVTDMLVRYSRPPFMFMRSQQNIQFQNIAFSINYNGDSVKIILQM